MTCGTCQDLRHEVRRLEGDLERESNVAASLAGSHADLREQLDAVTSERDALATRRDELLALAAKLTRDVPYEEESRNVATLIAEVGTLRARLVEVENTHAETQESVTAWANETFGVAKSNARIAARANEEMAELLRALTADDANPAAAAEVADVVIVLYRLASYLGVDLMREIDAKMAINRARAWAKDASGHGYHVRDKATP